MKLKKQGLLLAENLPSARCSPAVFSNRLAARKTNLTTARARKRKRSVRMLANARKDHSIPLLDGKLKFIIRFAKSPGTKQLRRKKLSSHLTQL